MSRQRRSETNVQFLKRMMEGASQYGALRQLFIMDAIIKAAKATARANLKELESPLVNAESWRGVAREVEREYEKHIS